MNLLELVTFVCITFAVVGVLLWVMTGTVNIPMTFIIASGICAAITYGPIMLQWLYRWIRG